MDNFNLKSLFIFDSTLKSKKKKPSDDEMQDCKLLYYYPNSEDQVIKRSNMGIVEGTISFMDAFEQSSSSDQFILVEMTKFYYIANKFDENKSIGMILQKTNNSEFTNHQNIQTKKQWFKIFLNNFYEMLILYQGPIHEIFFNNKKEDLREDNLIYKNICEMLNDFIVSYFEILPSSRMPFYDNVLYFPLNENSHSQLLLASQRLKEKMSGDIKYISLMYKGFLLHNEAPLESTALLYNSFFSNLESSPKYLNFNRPPYKVIQTVYTGGEEEAFQSNTSNFRKGFDTVGPANFLIGINRININNFHVFIPTIYIKSTNEKVKLLVFHQNGLLIFMLLNVNFNPQGKVNSLIKIERWVKRYFEEELPGLENLYQHRSSKFDSVTFAYVNYSNKSMKLSTNFYSKKNKTIDNEKIELLMNLMKINFSSNYSCFSKIKGFLVYYIVTCERKVVILLPDSIPISSVRSTIDEIKKDLFDYIFII